MPNQEWNKKRIESLISNKVEENYSLEYKAARALEDTIEISRDVSSFANASGGVIIYGVAERKEQKRNYPGSLDPIDFSAYPKERLEQVIGSNIRPRLQDMRITAVEDSDNPNNGFYVVEIQISPTAHQAGDLKYYRRYNFERLPMFDQEIRDVMNRVKHPEIELELDINRSPVNGNGTLEILSHLRNVGSIYASYVNYEMKIPLYLVFDGSRWDYNGKQESIDGIQYAIFTGDNTHRDVIETVNKTYGPEKIYGPARFVPILPNRTFRSKSVELEKEMADFSDFGDLKIYWFVYADNAPVKTGEIPLTSLRLR
jgi:hypothetical protein